MKFASLKDGIWELDNGVERHREAPETFFIPNEECRSALKSGDIVKLIFRIEFIDSLTGEATNAVERMWVVVTHVFEGFYLGRLDNTPDCLEINNNCPLQLGAEIPFRPEHVIAIHESPIADEELKEMLSTPSPFPWRVFDA